MLKGLLVGVPIAAGAATAASVAYVKDKGSDTLGTLEQRFEQLKTRFEQSDKRNQKLIKIALGAATLSLGIDVSALL
jgi:hypothetical protein